MRRAGAITSIAAAIGLAGALSLPAALAPASAAAQDQAEPAAAQEESPAESRSTEFKAVEGAPPTKDVPGGPLLIGAYGAVWLLLLLFVVRLGRLQGRTMQDVERLERTLGVQDDDGDGS